MNTPYAQRNVLEPWDYYRQMRDAAPIHYISELFGWVVFRYQDVLTVLNTSDVFSSNIRAYWPPEFGKVTENPVTASIIFMDPVTNPAAVSRHKQLRTLVTDFFSPKALQRFAPRIEQIVHTILDAVMDQGSMDVVEQFAYPIPMTVIGELLGVPAEHQADFKRWSAKFIEVNESFFGDIPRVEELDNYFLALLAERRHHPKQDVLSTLANATIEGAPLSEHELLGFCELLLTAGYETTVQLLCNLFRVFDEYPDVQQHVWKHEHLTEPMIEETLRYRASASYQLRIAPRDLDFGGERIAKGQLVLPCLASANRDERQFPEPDRFVLDRSPNRHLAFGRGGAHFCLGAPLARLEAKIALSVLRKRLVDVHHDSSEELEVLNTLASSVKHFSVTFREARR